MQRLRGGLVFKAHRLCVSFNSRLESNKEERRQTSFMPSRTSRDQSCQQHPCRRCIALVRFRAKREQVKVCRAFTLAPRPESGFDWLTCSLLARHFCEVVVLKLRSALGYRPRSCRRGRRGTSPARSARGTSPRSCRIPTVQG